MTTIDLVLERRRTIWDIVFGVLLVIAGIIILGHAVLFTVVSVFFIGWITLAGGVIALMAAVTQIRRGGFWSTALSGGLLTALGLMFLRNPGAAAVTLTLIAGTLFLLAGLTRLIAALEEPAYRWPLVLSGIISASLGLIVLFNLIDASFKLLGILLGVETLVEGVTLLVIGRLRVTAVSSQPDALPAASR